MQLFAGKLKFDANHDPITDIEIASQTISPRENFDNIAEAVITVFQIFIGEQWNLIFYDCSRSTDGIAAVLYFSGVICFGNIILMNLFLAMLLGNFEKASLHTLCKIEKQKCLEVHPNSAANQKTSKVAPVTVTVKDKETSEKEKESDKGKEINTPLSSLKPILKNSSIKKAEKDSNSDKTDGQKLTTTFEDPSKRSRKERRRKKKAD